MNKDILIGIYCIRNTDNGKRYIGSSNNILNIRWPDHKCRLNAGRHPNKHLQYSWNKHGSDAFEFSILELCQENMLDTREDAWMEYYDSMNIEKGYNKRPSKTGRGWHHTEESKNKISKSKTGIQRPARVKEICRLNLKLGHTKEAHAKSNKTRMGQKRTPEQIENLRIGALRRWSKVKKAGVENER